jgi:hypothetical protein
MDPHGHESVTDWLHRLAAFDDSTAQQQLWNSYFARLAAVALLPAARVLTGRTDELSTAGCYTHRN